MIKEILLFIVVLSVASADQDAYLKITNTLDPSAVCLDGSPPFLYIHEGFEASKFLIYFMGGGICSGYTLQSTLSDCYDRSFTNWGSSKGWPDTYKGQGILSTNPAINDMANWNKIIIGSCDSSMHQGYRALPITYKNQRLYFRGAANTRAHLRWIQQTFPLFRQATSVVVAGSQTGGIASILWSTYISSLLSYPSVISTIADSSIILLAKTYLTNIDYAQIVFSNIYKLANTDQKTPWDVCNSRFVNQQYQCFFFQNVYSLIQFRTLHLNSEYDSYVIQNLLQVTCLKEGNSQYTLSSCNPQQIQFIQQYRNLFRNYLTNYYTSINHNAWTIGCSQHGYINLNKYYDSQQQRVPAVYGYTMRQAIKGFVFSQQRIRLNEAQAWPSNTGCAR